MHPDATNQIDCIAPAPLNSAAPLLSERCAVSQRNCMASRALVDRVADSAATLSSRASQ